MNLSCNQKSDIHFIQGDEQIDVLIDNVHVTSYLYRNSLTKPALFPLRTLSGLTVTRGFPLEKIHGESEDHPHHVGLSFTYDEVNDNGFWANTTSPPCIKHIQLMNREEGKGKGILDTIMHWIDTKGTVLLEEKRKMVFYTGDGGYAVDFIITLTAQDTTVVFKDTKEGMFAIRTARWLAEKDGTGHYCDSRGREGSKAIWGRRAEWVALEGETDGRSAGVAMFNHPSCVNYPTFWHVRDYGLFSANPLGQFVFQQGTGESNPKLFTLTLKPGDSAFFRFMVVVYDGTRTKQEISEKYAQYFSLK